MHIVIPAAGGVAIPYHAQKINMHMFAHIIGGTMIKISVVSHAHKVHLQWSKCWLCIANSHACRQWLNFIFSDRNCKERIVAIACRNMETKGEHAVNNSMSKVRLLLYLLLYIV